MHITQCEQAWEPTEAALRLGRTPGLAWLDGGLVHGREGRFSFVATAPCEVAVRRLGDPAPLALPLPRPRACANETDVLRPEMIPHWVGYIAYDAHRPGKERWRLARTDGAPVVRFARYDALYAFDHETGRGYLVGDDTRACAGLAEQLETAPLGPAELAYSAGPVMATPQEQHRSAISAALVHVREGDVYEINLARRFRASFAGSPLGLFLRMREASPVPLGCFVDAGDHAVLGRSMERFLRLRVSDGVLWTSPIKGTIARLGDDVAEARALSSDPKEHAEHAMVVDLMRNDLSRVCEVGSVEVTELMAVLPFRGLSHLVSTVQGRAQAGISLQQLLEGTFPPGSVTGTPKERALEIIDALEDAPRGVYTGALGFIDRAGGCSFAVAIRTAVVAHGQIEYFAGGGIVAASDPERETAETELKAQAFLRALSG